MRKKILLTVLITLILFVFSAPKILYTVGLKYYDLKDYSKSSKLFETALYFSSKDSDYRYYYIKSLLNLKSDYYVQRKVYEISVSDIDDEAQKLAQKQVQKWKTNILNKYGKTYIEYTPADSSIIRWSEFPLKYYIKNTSSVPSYYTNSIIRALENWQNSIDFVSFEKTSSMQNAQLIFEFKPLPSDVCKGNVCKYVVGFTSPTITKGKLNFMTITLYERNPKNDYFSEKELYNTVLHELGHALGIMGHSNSKSDIMYQEAKNNRKFFSPDIDNYHGISKKDINTIKLLYKLEPDFTDTVISNKSKLIYTPIILGSKMQRALKKLQEAQIYIKKSPDIALGYINLAAAYVELDNNQEALKALNKAETKVKGNNEKFTLYYNYAYVYLNMKKYDTAMQYAQKAKKINESDDILELIQMISQSK